MNSLAGKCFIRKNKNEPLINDFHILPSIGLRICGTISDSQKILNIFATRKALFDDFTITL
jgi:hypothetical protein